MATTQKIKKRSGEIVDFNPEKITIVVKRAFAGTLGDSNDIVSKEVTNAVIDAIDAKFGNTAFIPTVEEVQDLVENAIADRGYFNVAKAYIIYRYEHAKIRETKKAEVAEKISENALLIEKRDGTKEAFSEIKLTRTLMRASIGYEKLIDIPAIVGKVRQEMFEGIKSSDIHEVLIMVVRSFIERDPAHSFVAAQLLLQTMYREVIGIDIYGNLEEAYKKGFINAINRGVKVGQFDPRMLNFDLERLANELQPERDREFKYLGLQTLQANYLTKEHGTKKLLETPQIFWMRVAMGCALAEKTPEMMHSQAIEFYEIMSAMYYAPSSPTLYHAGLMLPQLSSCFLSTVPDDLHAIFDEYKDGAQLLKYAGGLGVDWTPVRATGSLIKKTGVESQGVIPFLKIANDVTISINRSGRRRGAAAVYLEYWHADIEDFLELRKNTGDERRRAHDLNTAVWIPDLFMKRLQDDGYWTLFSPSDTPDLHDLYGRAFEARYEEYEALADQGQMAFFKRVRAGELWKKHLTMLFETGHPWITWKDPSNIRSPQNHVGVVHSSNLCTEITLNSSGDETAVCNLGSINMSSFVRGGKFDRELVARVVPVAMRMLDNVIDINFYPTEKTKRSNMRHRPVGLGLRGLQDALYKLNINFDTEEAVKFSDESMEIIAYHAILSSALLAKERGAYETYQGSKWSKGIFPQDTIALLEAERGIRIDVPRTETLDWRLVRDAVKQWGMRNSNTMANAPTASTANIVGCYPTIEPIYKNLYVKSNMAGDFMVVNEYLVEDLKKLGMWNSDMLEKIKYFDGSIQEIEEIPPALRAKYKEVFEMEPSWLIKAAAYRGRWMDMSQSLNIFYSGTSGKVLSEIYQYAWNLGLKTTYYLRSMGASRIEKSTINLAKFGGTSSTDSAKQPSADAPTPSAIIVEETVIAATINASVPSPAIFTEQISYAGMKTSTAPSMEKPVIEMPKVEMPKVVLAEPKKFEFGKSTTTSIEIPASAPVGVSAFVAGKTADEMQLKRPQIEIMGEACESCSA